MKITPGHLYRNKRTEQDTQVLTVNETWVYLHDVVTGRLRSVRRESFLKLYVPKPKPGDPD